MKIKKTTKKLLVALAIIALPVVAFLRMVYKDYENINSPEVMEYYKQGNVDMRCILTPQDSVLFNLEKAQLSSPFHLRTSNLRNDIREIGVYDNIGLINYTSINIKKDFSLDDIIFSPQETIPEIKGHWVTPIATQLCQQRPADSIIFSYIGDSKIQMRKFNHSDDFKSYTLFAKALSIKYGENEPPDITIGQYVSQFCPISFAFLKKDSLLYVIVYGPNTKKVSVEEALNRDYLGEFVKWRDS
ncbi:MAG: hypothetical protein LBR57_03975 [Alistipes sp.]|jgi:hypothetical protein|nr:hypothetical protein [Alistipes sp.]